MLIVGFNNYTGQSLGFGHKVGCLLDKRALGHKIVLKSELDSQLSKKAKNIPDAFEAVLKKFFPDTDIKVKDIKDADRFIESDSSAKVLSDIELNHKHPKSVIFIDANHLKKMKKAQSDDTLNLFVQKALEHNDINFVSKVANDFSSNIQKTKEISMESVKGLIDDINKRFNLDVLVDLKQETFPTVGMGPRANAKSFVDFVNDKHVQSEINADFTHSVEDLKPSLVHEYTHVLQHNSPMFNIDGFPLIESMVWNSAEPKLMNYGVLLKTSPIQDNVNVNGFSIPVLNQNNKGQILSGILDDSTRIFGDKNDVGLLKGLSDRAHKEAQAHTKTQEIANYQFDKWGCDHYGTLYQEFANSLKESMNKLTPKPEAQKPSSSNPWEYLKSFFVA